LSFIIEHKKTTIYKIVVGYQQKVGQINISSRELYSSSFLEGG